MELLVDARDRGDHSLASKLEPRPPPPLLPQGVPHTTFLQKPKNGFGQRLGVAPGNDDPRLAVLDRFP